MRSSRQQSDNCNLPSAPTGNKQQGDATGQIGRRTGITEKANSFRVFGVRARVLGLLWHTAAEGRLAELMASTLLLAQYAFALRTNPLSATRVVAYTERLKRFSAGYAPILARMNSISEVGGVFVAGEYGQPGARILVRENGREAVHNPYANEKGVFHIHAMLPLGESRYLVSTGDRKKTLDVVAITMTECRILRRLVPFLGGYTALALHQDSIWVGSDLAERANYIAELHGSRRHFLPPACARNYVLHMESVSHDKLLVISKRLNTRVGHACVFCTSSKRFVMSNRIGITEVIEA